MIIKMNKSGLILIDVSIDVSFKIYYVDLISNFIRILTKEKEYSFIVDINQPNFIYKNTPYYVLIESLPNQIILPKCVIKTLKYYIDMLFIKEIDSKLFKKIIKSKKEK